MIVSKHTVLINTTRETLLSVLLDHQNLSKYFDASFKVARSEDDGEITGGQGCIRQVSIFGIRFYEQISSANIEGICYHITGNFPMRNHQGQIRFEKENDKTRVTYQISCGPLWYTPNVLMKFILDKQILTAFKHLGAAF